MGTQQLNTLLRLVNYLNIQYVDMQYSIVYPTDHMSTNYYTNYSIRSPVAV